MKIQFLLAVFFSITINGCVMHSGNGNIISKTIPSESFNKMEISGPYDVEVRKGNNNAVIVEADENLMKYMEVSVHSNRLIARIRSGSFSNSHFKLLITTPLLKYIKASGGTDITLTNGITDADKIEIELSGSGSLKGTVDAPVIDINTSSGANADVSGRTRKLNVSSSSGSSVNAGNLLSEETVAEASSGAAVHVHASVKLKASASSGAEINYKGGANVDQTISSGGEINKE